MHFIYTSARVPVSGTWIYQQLRVAEATTLVRFHDEKIRGTDFTRDFTTRRARGRVSSKYIFPGKKEKHEISPQSVTTVQKYSEKWNDRPNTPHEYRYVRYRYL